MLKKFSFIIFCSFLLSSCTIQKRHYESGFTITRNKTLHSYPSENTAVVPDDNANLSASIDSITMPLVSSNIFIEKTFLLSKDSCDLLEFKNTSTLSAKVIEISANTIRYKRCDNPDGPDYVSEKSEITSITFSNGEKEIFQSPVISIAESPMNNETPKRIKPKKAFKSNHDKTDLAWSFGSRSLIPFAGIVFSILGIIFGILALVEIRKYPSDNAESNRKDKLKVIAGLVLSVIGLAVGILAIIFMAWIFTALSMID